MKLFAFLFVFTLSIAQASPLRGVLEQTENGKVFVSLVEKFGLQTALEANNNIVFVPTTKSLLELSKLSDDRLARVLKEHFFINNNGADLEKQFVYQSLGGSLSVLFKFLESDAPYISILNRTRGTPIGSRCQVFTAAKNTATFSKYSEMGYVINLKADFFNMAQCPLN